MLLAYTTNQENMLLDRQQYNYAMPFLAGSNDSQNNFRRPAGPSNRPFESLPPGYIAHIPPYYQINSDYPPLSSLLNSYTIASNPFS